MSVRGFEHVLFRLAMIGDNIETSRHRNDIIGSWYVGKYLQHTGNELLGWIDHSPLLGT
jgi:hypothetical protein